MSAHRIQLRGPWDYAWLGGPPGDDDPAAAPMPLAGVVKVPATWEDLFGSRAGRARFRRRFHRPTNLDASERLYIIVEGLADEAIVELDGRRLGSIVPPVRAGEFEVTAFVRPNSELTLELSRDPHAHEARPGVLWDAVAIEIRRS